MRTSIFLPLLLLLFFVSAIPVDARVSRKLPKKQPQVLSVYDIPSFPPCPNPGGTLVNKYDEGWHWIVGNDKLQWGSDTVSHIGNDNYVQCYCPNKPDEGNNDYTNGIQTNWLKASNVSTEVGQWLLTQGWLEVVNGADFGLKPEKYLAQNLPFNCKSTVCNTTITQSNHTNAVVTISAVGNSGNNSLNGSTGGNVKIDSGKVENSTVTNEIGGTNQVLTNSACVNCVSDMVSVVIEGNGANSTTNVQISSISAGR